MVWPAIIAAASTLGGAVLGARSARRASQDNAAINREFAQQGIRWKVADARAAGLHPLAALGASSISPGAPYQAFDYGPSFTSMGQNIGRAIEATRTAPERAEAAAIAIGTARAQQHNVELQNMLLQQQIRNAQVGPPMPSGVQTYPVTSNDVITRDLVDIKPAEVISARSEDPSTMAGPAGPTFREYDMGWMGKWKLPEGQFFEDSEILKAIVAMMANRENFGRMNNLPPKLLYDWLNRPEWVDRVAKREGFVTLLPFYKADGKQYWKGFKAWR